MKTLAILYVLLFPLALLAQKPETRNIDGVEYECTENGDRLECKNCKRVATDEICEVRIYTEKSRYLLHGFAKNGRFFGIWTHYKGKELLRKMSYQDGIRHGITEYYDKGKLQVTLTYNNGILDGEIRRYFTAKKANNLMSLIPISNGLVHGEVIEYVYGGGIFVKTNYVHGVRHGKTFMYDSDNIGEVTFNQGKMTGNLLLKDVHGKPSFEFVLDPSKTHFNQYIKYNKDGSIKKAGEWKYKLPGDPDDYLLFHAFPVDEQLANKIVVHLPAE